MIIAALGFAAIENMLILFSASYIFAEATLLMALRFIGATFLHALCSGLLGYFLALSFFATRKKRIKFVLMGLGISTLLHGFFNFCIITIEGYLKFIIPIIILIALAVFVRFGFKKVKKMTSICKFK
jgi:RsiW-degrading membrane proteinase PrsW (M82 family)